mgnify:FL=1
MCQKTVTYNKLGIVFSSSWFGKWHTIIEWWAICMVMMMYRCIAASFSVGQLHSAMHRCRYSCSDVVCHLICSAYVRLTSRQRKSYSAVVDSFTANAATHSRV